MLGINKISTGRMGNRLFQYHFLRQVAEKTGIDYFHPDLPDSEYFEGMNKKNRPFPLLRRKMLLTSKEILNFKPDAFFDFLRRQHNADIDILFQPPILGEVFFDYLFNPPSHFIRIKSKYKINFSFNHDNKKIIGLHFRGTDFKNWNEHASLEFEYYKNSIEFCLQFYSDQSLVFVLFTDDLNFDAFTKTTFFLKSLKVEFYISDNSRPPIYDFYHLSECDILISSPSTFAIFAGCIGKQKMIIHARSWLDYAVKQDDTFWVKLSKTKNPFYSLWKII